MNSIDKQRVYIRGAGMVCSLGSTQTQIADACKNFSGDAPTAVAVPQVSPQPIAYFAIGEDVHPTKSRRLYEFIDYAVAHALEDSGLSTKELANTAVFSGSTACDISDLEERYVMDLAKDPEAMPLYRSGFGVLAGYVRDKFALGGEEYSFNTACSSSANAFLTAARMIAAGRCEHALILGVEVLNQLSLQGFASMMLLSPDSLRPFDAQRNGTILGEAVACVVLSGKPPAQSQYCSEQPFYVLGGANLCDTKNVTSSDAEAVAQVMQQALRDAGLRADQIDVIKAHGTATPNNDQAEALAMRQVFATGLPPFTSLKPYLGHTLGACGVAEMSLLLATIKHGYIAKTPGFSGVDPQLQVEPLREHRGFHSGTIMLNYFGFGGNNSSLIMSNR